MAISSSMAFQVICCSVQRRPSIPNNYALFKTAFSSTVKPWIEALHQTVPDSTGLMEAISETMKNASAKMLDAFVDSVFEFVDQPLLPSQSNYAPVDELGGPVVVSNIEGNIPDHFPQGVYIRNGPNPLFGGLKSTKSVFGKSNHVWVEGEGMLHALYFSKNNDCNWTVHYDNRYVETETFKLEKQRNRPSFLPTIGGDSSAVLSAYLLNLLRFGKVNKYISNTNVFEQSGKIYSIAENHMPQEIDISTLETLGNWHLSQAWNRPFTSHPKRAPNTGELVIIGVDAIKPYLEIGVISADGNKIVHRADIKLGRCTLCHDFGVTQRYNVLMDFPLTIDIMRLVNRGPLIKYNKEEYARIGIMPRYGHANSIKWFQVEPNCTFHILNCFEDGDDEVVIWGCRALESVIDSISSINKEKIEISSTRDDLLCHRPYEWRLNMRTGQVREKNLTDDSKLSMDFPMINPNFTGLGNRFAYTQVVDPMSSSSSAAFVPKEGGLEEDDGWIVTFVHNEDTNTSQVLVIGTKKFSDEPVAKITLPCRVPYGFHGTFIPLSM
ncbi:hypothetical protein TIFTF001_009195 [Ficus carica]|uniref:Uncharacterized protein n=1 Tax=Ficus carica TaxID=3494 RepID=A0AA88A6D6_FICCA|nr:hypothetical protein TIFTF001_009195 [Ficus carica]